METSSFREAVATILERELSPTECRVVKDDSCGGDQPLYLDGPRTSLNERENRRADLLVIRKQFIYVIVNVVNADLPARLIWDNFLSVALSDHFLYSRRASLPVYLSSSVLFIHLLDASEANLPPGALDRKVNRLERSISRIIPVFQCKIQKYRVLSGDSNNKYILARQVITEIHRFFEEINFELQF